MKKCLVTRYLGLLILTAAAFACSISAASAQTQITLFQFLNKANNGCIRVEAPPPKAIIAGHLRTFFCGQSGDGLIDRGNDAPAFLKFDLGNGELRCINVRGIDMKTFPSDIFANTCGSPTSRWSVGGINPDGFNDIRLFRLNEPDTLCMGVDATRRTVVIDTCVDNKPEQLWKLVPITKIIN